MRDRILLMLTAALMGWIGWRLFSAPTSAQSPALLWASVLAAGLGAFAGLAGSFAAPAFQRGLSVLFVGGLLVGPAVLVNRAGVEIPGLAGAPPPESAPQPKPEPKAGSVAPWLDETNESLALLILGSALGLTAGLTPQKAKKRASS
jgi:hypothetical protein